jgi:hypothetical protein
VTLLSSLSSYIKSAQKPTKRYPSSNRDDLGYPQTNNSQWLKLTSNYGANGDAKTMKVIVRYEALSCIILDRRVTNVVLKRKFNSIRAEAGSSLGKGHLLLLDFLFKWLKYPLLS